MPLHASLGPRPAPRSAPDARARSSPEVRSDAPRRRAAPCAQLRMAMIHAWGSPRPPCCAGPSTGRHAPVTGLAAALAEGYAAPCLQPPRASADSPVPRPRTRLPLFCTTPRRRCLPRTSPKRLATRNAALCCSGVPAPCPRRALSSKIKAPSHLGASCHRTFCTPFLGLDGSGTPGHGGWPRIHNPTPPLAAEPPCAVPVRAAGAFAALFSPTCTPTVQQPAQK